MGRVKHKTKTARRLITMNELASFFQVHRNTMRSWIEQVEERTSYRLDLRDIVSILWFVINKTSDLQQEADRFFAAPRGRTRWQVFQRDNFTCQYCGKKATQVELEVDHKVSRHNGGDNSFSNLITACFECNRGKTSDSTLK